jgi:heme exporter protein B
VRYAADTLALARKDLLLELRGRETVPAAVVFVVGALVVFRFALPDEQSDAAKGLLWVAILFTALLALTRAFAAERDQGLLDALVLAPCDRSAIWLGKVIATLAFLVLVEAVALPAFSLFFERVDAATVAAVALANVGICAVGTLLAAMAAGGRARELLLPVLFLPVAVPILVGGVGATVADDPGRYLAFLGLYDATFAILAWAGFEYVVTE